MNIEVARIHRLDGKSRVKAFVDVRIDGALLIKGFRIIEGEKGYFISMPSVTGADNKWYDTVRILNNETKEEINNIIMSKYMEV